MRNEKVSDMGTQAWAHRVVAFHSVSELPIKTASPSKLLNDWVGTYISINYTLDGDTEDARFAIW